ncbi:MAG: bifunctional riboflavin kinase/FAD synthetase [Alphaproteobacteria bacterium]|nr:bifunctional riboflavin kinase/FAD synthetase [Alphaproteobacteria bacterium]
MQVIRLSTGFLPKQQHAVIAIGNFDGLHLGHQAIVSKVQEVALNLKKPSGILTFTPHPKRFFNPTAQPFQLTSWRSKAELIASYGIEFLYIHRFNQQLVYQQAADFIKNILIGQLKVAHLVIGHDFCFGYQRQGNVALLQQYSEYFKTSIVPAISTKTTTHISSTVARQYLQQAQLLNLRTILGHPWYITGRVQQGKQLARQLGFPTANIAIDTNTLLPLYGSYAVRVAIDTCKQPLWPGVANLGIRPTFQGEKPILEVHLFNYDNSLYGRRLYVYFEEFIRPEKKFEGLDALRQQIHIDSQHAQNILKKLTINST